MKIFTTTLGQMAFLFLLIALGYILKKIKIVPDNTPSVLSKLENNALIPALVMGTLMTDFTREKLSASWQYLIGGTAVTVVSMVLAIIFSRIIVKDRYERNMFAYGLTFSNFGFMGNAIVLALFPKEFPFYLILTIPLWILIYVWGVPSLLMPQGEEKEGILSRLRKIINPMFISMLIGMMLGISGAASYMPKFLSESVNTLGSCMSPVAMLLTGMTIARYRLKDILCIKSVYGITAIRLLLLPALFILASKLIPMSQTAKTCAFCAVAMPLGLNTVVIPAAYGKDTSTASGMALVSHFLSCATIPLMFALMDIVTAL